MSTAQTSTIHTIPNIIPHLFHLTPQRLPDALKLFAVDLAAHVALPRYV